MAKKQKAQEAVDIFSVLAEGDEPEAGKGEEGAPKGGDPASLARIEALEAELRRLERTNTALMSQNPPYTAPVAVKGTEGEEDLDFSGLPDPVTDQDNYHKEVTKRIATHLRAQQERDNAALVAQMQAQQSQEARVQALWTDFEERYPDLAEHRELVEVAAVSVANKARAKGVDVQRYMFTASDQYIEDVAQEIKRKYGKAIEVMGKGEGEGEEPSGDEPEGGTMAEALTAARTRGIQGGLPTSGKGGKKGEETGEDANDSFIGDLQKVQRAMGII